MNKEEIFASFWEHLDDLRLVVIRSLIAIGIGMGIAFLFYPQIFELINQPLHQNLFSNENNRLQRFTLQQEKIANNSSEFAFYRLSPEETVVQSLFSLEKEKDLYQISPGGYLNIESKFPVNRLIILGPSDGMVLTVKICFWVGLIVSSPFWLFFIFQFISPALRNKERKLIPIFLFSSALSITLGILFAYFITIPAANQYLQLFNQDLGRNLWTLSNYLNFTLTLLLANAIAFELCVVLFFLVHFGVFTYEALKSKRRHIIVGSLIVAALLTPPDVLTQVLLAIPLMAFYECAILYAKRKRQKAQNSYVS